MSCPFGKGSHVMRHGLCGTVTRVSHLPGGGTELTVRLDSGGGNVTWNCAEVEECTEGQSATGT